MIDTLFRPFPFGGEMMRNRIVMAPMTRSKEDRECTFEGRQYFSY